MPALDLSNQRLPAHRLSVPKDLRWFEVDEQGRISLPNAARCRTREDVYPTVASANPRTVKALLDLIEGCSPLLAHFGQLASQKLTSLKRQLNDPRHLEALCRGDVEQLKQLHDLLSEDLDEAWWRWIELMGVNGIPAFQDHIDAWIQDAVDWNEVDFFEVSFDPMSTAFEVLQSVGVRVLDALGIRLVEGACPSSDYCFAQLYGSMDSANALAAELGLAYRFRAEPSAFNDRVALPVAFPMAFDRGVSA